MDADAWNRRYAGAELVWTAEPSRFLVAETAGLAPGRALDVAAGEGRNAVWLAERGWRVTAVDFSDVAIEKARALAERRGVELELVVADVLAYTPPAGAFDLVAELYLHLLPDEHGRVLARSAAALAPGGTLLVVGHHRANVADGYGGPQDPAILHEPDEIAAALEREGLAVERAERVLRPVETPGGERQAIDSLVRARRAAA